MYPFFFFTDTATTEIYTLSLHDALPIYAVRLSFNLSAVQLCTVGSAQSILAILAACRSEEHTSELQSQSNLVCRLLLEKKKRRTPGRARPTPPAARAAYRLHLIRPLPAC